MKKAERIALARVIDYLWRDEWKSYGCCASPDHIFLSLRKLRPLVEAELSAFTEEVSGKMTDAIAKAESQR